MSDTLATTRHGVEEVLTALRPFVEAASKVSWTPTDGYRDLVLRAALCRQFECLEVISQLTAEGKGYAAGPLLRPSCEEYIWSKYLLSLDRSIAERLLACFASREILENLRAQDDYAGREVTEELGLLPYLEGSRQRKAGVRKALEQLADELGWPNQDPNPVARPSMRWLAKQTGERKTYEFIYHATSRFVHFGVTELLRRAWGTPESVSVSSAHFRDYWAHFSLYWGLNLFLNTTSTVAPVLEVQADLDEDTLLAAAQRIADVGAVPIITAEELAWPD